LALSLAVLCSMPLAAQTPATIEDYALEPTGFGFHIEIMGNTLNNDFVAFYEHYSGGLFHLKSCTVPSTGGPLGAKHFLKPGIAQADYGPWDVAWHPVVKRFMFVYATGGKLYARAVGVDGAPLGPPRYISDYDGKYLQVTWAAKRKFIVFLRRNDQVAAQTLRKNAKKYKAEKQLVDLKTGISLPLDAVSEEDGTAAAYYTRFRADPGEADVCVLRVDYKLNVLSDYDLVSGLPATAEISARYVHGNYDPAKSLHAVVYRIGLGPARYATFEKDGSWKSAPKDLPTDATPHAVLYNPLKKRFAVFYYKLNYFGGSDHAEYYLTVFRPDGKILAVDKLLKRTESEDETRACGYNRTGKVFVAWVNEIVPPGVLGRLIY
jgi:hypothetical protein